MDHKPCAFLYAVVYGKTLIPDSVGYDPAFAQGSPGSYLFEKFFEDVIENTCINTIDFGFGDADYKLLFCNDRWMESSIYVFSPDFRTLVINFLRSVICLLDCLLVSISQRLRLTQKIKTMWRKRMVAKKLPQKRKAS